MQIEANYPYWVWYDGRYYEGMLLGERDAEACATDVALLEWLGNVWARWDRIEPWWEVSGDGGETRFSLQLPFPGGRDPLARYGVSPGNWILRYGGTFREIDPRDFAQEGFVVGHLAAGLPAVNLMDWCSTDELRPSLQRPWTVGNGYTYATDGKSGIRVAATGIDYSNGRYVGNHPNLEQCIDFGFVWPRTKIALWMPLPEVELREAVMECPDCKGSGLGAEVFCECCEVSHRCGKCEACEGAKKRLQPLPVVTGSGLIAWDIYERLRALPGCEIGILEKFEALNQARISFRFEGGSGLVMGVTWEGNGLRERDALAEVMEIRAGLADFMSAALEGVAT